MSVQLVQVLESLTEEQIAEMLSPEVRDVARELVEKGYVKLLGINENGELESLVNYGNLCEVRFAYRDGALMSSCSCDHRKPGYCVHIGAVLFACLKERGQLGAVDRTGLVQNLRSMLSGSASAREYREMLNSQTIKELREIAREHGIRVKSTRKEVIANAVADYLLAPGKMRSIILGLDELQRSLLVHLHLVLSLSYGMLIDQIADYWSDIHSGISLRALQEQVMQFYRKGLLLTFTDRGDKYYLMPSIVRENLPPQPQLLSTCVVRTVRSRPAAAILQKFYAFWNALIAGNASDREPMFKIRAAPRRHPIEDQLPQLRMWRHLPSEIEQLVEQRRSLSSLYGTALTIPPAPYHLRSSDRRTMRKHTKCSDEEVEFLCALLEYMGLIIGRPGEPIVPSLEGFKVLAGLPPAAQLKVLGIAWLYLPSWSEVDIVLRSTDEIRLRRNLIYLSYEPVHLYQEWLSGRETVYRYLYLLTEGTWVSLDSFLHIIYDISPDLFHEMSESGVWWIESTKSKKQFGTDFDDWRQGFGRFVTAVLEGPMYWLGMVDLGYEGEQLKAIRLTPVGSYLIGRRDNFTTGGVKDQARDTVRLGEGMTISVVPSTAPARLHELLHRIGKLEEITPNYFTYRITAEGVISEMERGSRPEKLVATLQKLCGVELPASWKKQMHTWVQNYGKLHLYEDISLIEMADEYALHELKINTSLSKHIVHQFSPRLVAVHTEAIDTLIQEMEKKGYTPRVID